MNNKDKIVITLTVNSQKFARAIPIENHSEIEILRMCNQVVREAWITLQIEKGNHESCSTHRSAH